MTKKFAKFSTAASLLLFLVAPPAQAEISSADGISLSGSYLAGRSAEVGRDSATAAEYLSQALLEDPDNPVLIEKLFVLELASGDLPTAEVLARKVIASNSQHKMARIVLGLRDFRKSRYTSARKNFVEAAYTPVGELTSALAIAWTLAAEGNLKESLAALDALDSNESFANFKSYHAALIADQMKNAIRAEASYRKAYGQAASSLRIVQAYGNFLERNNRSAEAIKIYQAFLEAGNDNVLIRSALENAKSGKIPAQFIATPSAGLAESLFSLASAMTDEQSIDIALLYAQLALSLPGDRPVYLTLLGDIYVDTRQFENAISAYDLIPAESPLRMSADTEIAVNLQRLERTKDAQAKLKDVIARDSSSFEVLVTLGNIHRGNEEYALASEAYTKALDLITNVEKDHWRVFYYRGITFERQKMWDKAEADFRKALALVPDEPLVLNYLGYSMIEKKVNLTEALDMVKKAVELKPNDGYIVDSLGWAYYQLGDFAEAVVHIERAVDLNPADPIIGEHLGDVYWRVGRKLEAKFQWQHAKDNGPEPADLKRIEDKLLNGMPPDEVTKPVENKTGNTSG